MKRIVGPVLNRSTGLPVIGARLTLLLPGTTTKATLYETNDPDGPIVENPLVSDELGLVSAYVPDGTYDREVSYSARMEVENDLEIYDLDEISALAHTNFDPLLEAAAETEAARAAIQPIIADLADPNSKLETVVDNIDDINLTASNMAAIQAAPAAAEASLAAATLAQTAANGPDFTNLFNPDTVLLGYALSPGSGLAVVNADFYIADYMPAEASTTYGKPVTTLGTGTYYSFYDGNQKHISTSLVPKAATSFTTPANTRYMRTSPRIVETPPATFMVVKGAALPPVYVPSIARSLERKGAKDIAGGYAGTDANNKVRASVIPTVGNLTNLFVANTHLPNAALEANTGATVTNSIFYTTDHMAVVPDQVHQFPTPATTKYVAFYDPSKVYMPNSTILSSGSFVPPAGAAYARISARYSDTPVSSLFVVRGGTLPFRADSPLTGKIIAGIGDSITWGFIPRNAPGYNGQLASWLVLLANKLGASWLNYGSSGSTLLTGSGSSNPGVTRYAAMSDDADLINVMFGTNDCRTATSRLGVMGDTVTTTFYGALDTMCQGLLQKYRYGPGVAAGSNKKIMFSTALRLLDPATGGLDANLPLFNEATKRVCDKYCIPVFDAYNLSGLTPDLFKTLQGTEPGYTGMYNPYVTDGTHPTHEGHQMIADAMGGFIRRLYE